MKPSHTLHTTLGVLLLASSLSCSQKEAPSESGTAEPSVPIVEVAMPVG